MVNAEEIYNIPMVWHGATVRRRDSDPGEKFHSVVVWTRKVDVRLTAPLKDTDLGRWLFRDTASEVSSFVSGSLSIRPA